MSLPFVEFKNQCLQDNKVYIKQTQYPISNKKLEGLKRIAYIQKYYQCNPVRFISDFFNIELLDAQAWILTQAWTCPNVLLVCTRGFGKSTLIDLMLMAKGMLFGNYWSYICSGSSSQAQTTFTTLERIANDNIDTMVGSTGKIFKAEVEVKNASGDGFVHSSDGFKYSLYNGSQTVTLNSNFDRKRGLRGNVVFDEGAFLSEELLNTYAAFAIVNKEFKLGRDADGNLLDMVRIRAIPPEIQNQKFYISSASSTDTEYYRLYREFSKKMLMGDKHYFVAQIDCYAVFKPTMHGKVVRPLLSEETVNHSLKINPIKARREYLCEFEQDAGADAIVRRGIITRNEETRRPLLYNDTGGKKFIITYDPARNRDNSIILVMEMYEDYLPDGSIDLKGRIVNCINLVDVGKKIKSPMQTPDQLAYLKQLILDYNAGADSYGNIVTIGIDGGAGGGGYTYADFLTPDWTTADGIVHRGLIDKEVFSEYVSRYPNAVNKVKVISPSGYKSIMFEAMIEMLNQDKISFTAPYDNKGYLTIFDSDDGIFQKEKQKVIAQLKKEKLDPDVYNQRLKEELGKISSIKTKMLKLDWKEELALSNIDALKEEVVNIVRKKRESGRDSFDLAPEKANILHDDRCYTLAMASYILSEERRKLILQKPKANTTDLVDKLYIRRGSFNGKKI